MASCENKRISCAKHTFAVTDSGGGLEGIQASIPVLHHCQLCTSGILGRLTDEGLVITTVVTITYPE